MKENSYTELMKSSAMNKGKKNYIQDLYIEMLLSEVLLKAEQEKLIVQINQALDTRNKEAFRSCPPILRTSQTLWYLNFRRYYPSISSLPLLQHLP